jgi:putative resolvase
MKQGEPKLLCVSKAAHELGQHPFTMRCWIKLGIIDAVWFGQVACIPRSEIECLVDKSNRGSSCSKAVSEQGQRADLETHLAHLQV